jgi:phage tail-like protein
VSDPLYPLSLFRFHVEFRRQKDNDISIAHGAFSDCTGLEATMEPKVIKAGGANYGPFQRPGQVTFATVILKRGVTTSRDLWKWFSHVNERGMYAFRLDVKIRVYGDTALAPPPGEPHSPPQPATDPALTIRLFRALPVKLKSGDLSAKATEVGIEELHLAHEGLTFE